MTLSNSFLCYLALALALFTASMQAQFTLPTPAELAMTSIPQVKDAPAVYLYKEDSTDEALHMHSLYVRLKVLTEGGLEYANVDLPYYAGTYGNTIDSISARTIQPDGTIVPFTGKPYDKVLERAQSFSIKSKVFTLPAVKVGSILEYRYKIRSTYFEGPDWYLQSPLYTVSAHYVWKTLGETMYSVDTGDLSNTVAWSPVLPPGAKVETREVSGAHNASEGYVAGGRLFELTVHDIAPLLTEPNSPPLNSLSYRVLFYYTNLHSPQEFWSEQGKRWSKNRDKFMEPGSRVKAAVQQMLSPADTETVKTKKIYDAVERIENTDLTREHLASEDHAAGLKAVSTVEDVLQRGRGTSGELTQLFVSMARVAGLKAYVMKISDRNEHIFLADDLNYRQLDDYIAIVSIDGTETFFDPGERYCTFKLLAWQHTMAGGLRQTPDGTKLAITPQQSYNASITKRVADLTLDDHGQAAGTVTLSYTGNPALNIRHQALRGDDSSLNTELRRRLENLLPGGMEVHVTSTENLADSDKPLVVKYEIKGPVGNPTGKRLFVPANLFEVNAKPLFNAPSRQLTVDMHYPHLIQDAVRIRYPSSYSVEALPAAETEQMGDGAGYTFSSKAGGDAISMFRNVTIAKTFFPPANYPQLRAFYGKLETKQQEPLILTRTPEATIAKPAPAGN